MSFLNNDKLPETLPVAPSKEFPGAPPDEDRLKKAFGNRWNYTITALFFIWSRSVDHLPIHGFLDGLQNTVLDAGTLWFIYLAAKSWWMSVVSSRSRDTYVLPAFGAIYLAAGILAHKMPAVYLGLVMILKKINDERYRSH